MEQLKSTLNGWQKKVVAKQNPDEYEPWQKALICSAGQKCDWTDKKYLEPLLKFIGFVPENRPVPFAEG